MRAGLHIPLFGDFAEPRLVAELAAEAEQAGWDGFFVWDHIAPPWHPVAGEPWITLAAIATATSRLRIGTLVTPLARRRPWKVARETVALDHLSRGRMVLGVGIGGTAAEGFGGEFDDFGEMAATASRGEMLDEALDVVTGLWSGEAFSHEGRFYHVRNQRFLPRPLQQPRIPVWVAATWPHRAPLRRAARWDGVFPTIRSSEEALVTARLGDVLRVVEEYRTDGRPFEVIRGGETSGVDEAADTARVTAAARAGATWWLESVTPGRWGGWDPWPTAAVRERIRQGPPRPDASLPAGPPA